MASAGLNLDAAVLTRKKSSNNNCIVGRDLSDSPFNGRVHIDASHFSGINFSACIESGMNYLSCFSFDSRSRQICIEWGIYFNYMWFKQDESPHRMEKHFGILLEVGMYTECVELIHILQSPTVIRSKSGAYIMSKDIQSSIIHRR